MQRASGTNIIATINITSALTLSIKVDPSCIEAYNNFKLGKKCAFILFGFNEDATKIVVLNQEPKGDKPEKSKCLSLFMHHYPFFKF